MLLLRCNVVFAQNLIPNYSFEDTVACPITGFIGNAAHWKNPTGYSPDYYNSCVADTGCCNVFSVPNNSYGNQTARTGVAYAGIITAFICCDAREYIQTKLTERLEAGKKYCISFFVCLTDSSPYAVNDIGAYISSDSIWSTGLINLPYVPQITNDPQTNPLVQRDLWIEVTDSFYAQGGELYITIGNFYDDANTDTVNFITTPPNPQYAYYYIDDVSLMLCDSTTSLGSEKQHKTFNVYPNPVSDGIIQIDFFEANTYTISLTNVLGDTLAHSKILIRSPNLSYKYEIKDISDGFYWINIISGNYTFSQKIVVIN